MSRLNLKRTRLRHFNRVPVLGLSDLSSRPNRGLNTREETRNGIIRVISLPNSDLLELQTIETRNGQIIEWGPRDSDTTETGRSYSTPKK